MCWFRSEECINMPVYPSDNSTTDVSVCVLTEMKVVRCSLLKQQVTVGYEKSVIFVVFQLFYKNTAKMISHVKYLYLK